MRGGWEEIMVTGEDSDTLCELEAIEKELEELIARKEQLEKLGQSDECPTFYQTETPYGGIYMLPPPQLNQEDGPPEQEVKTGPETPESPAVPVRLESVRCLYSIFYCSIVGILQMVWMY
ncbi:hypothetical protein L3Q82_010637 [Scortum barcoo]|uniref:Uncharacterized protein n=1 Tax=Scortum barcoo TaxID=214431 RepID=A0ACB8WC02_9TELE|nr:hypothetical protein L3Q82_010637 [Scortum barcoo]